MADKYVTYDSNGHVTGCYGDEPGNGANFMTVSDAQFLVVMQSKFGWQGWTVANQELISPAAAAEPSAEEQAAAALASAAQAAFQAGLQVKSNATPSLNGTFSVDQVSQMDILSIETSINAGRGFPGGSQSFSYPDMSGVMHDFTEADFTNFAAAVRDYVYALKSCISGALSALPSQSVTIS
ncbi:hypothetical protein [Burkholderia gladioli]|uniref:hypothetical protein n=1 Tax=Burkholderia gladioli TaxID=28095 RepID=UPI001640C6F3|nr:hypothetical protein [Burkholderia gladioli]